jgi:hypothetical protein
MQGPVVLDFFFRPDQHQPVGCAQGRARLRSFVGPCSWASRNPRTQRRIQPVPTPSSSREQRTRRSAPRGRIPGTVVVVPRVPTLMVLLAVQRRRCVASLVPRVARSLTRPHERRALAGPSASPVWQGGGTRHLRHSPSPWRGLVRCARRATRIDPHPAAHPARPHGAKKKALPRSR